MVRYRKGKRKREDNVWMKAGGRQAIIQAFHRHGVGKGRTKWPSLAVSIFKTDEKKMAKWLQTVWREDRQGVREEVIQTDRRSGKYHECRCIIEQCFTVFGSR